MAVACLACNFAVRSSSADGVVGLARHLGRSLVTEVSVMFVGMNAFVPVWARLLTGFLQQGSVLRHSSEDALEHAHDEAAGTARSRSW
jgi:hypothetical protein